MAGIHLDMTDMHPPNSGQGESAHVHHKQKEVQVKAPVRTSAETKVQGMESAGRMDLEHEKYSQDEIEAIFAKLREQQVRAMEKELENQNVGQSNKRQNQLCKGSDSGNADSSNPAPETLDSGAIAAKHDALFEECCRELHVGTDDDSDGDDMRMDEDEQETSIPMKK